MKKLLESQTEKMRLAVLYRLEVRVTGQVENTPPEKGWHVKWKEEDDSEMPKRENVQGLSFGINVVWKGRGKGRNGGEAKS